MWVHIPSQCYPCFPAWADSTSASTPPSEYSAIPSPLPLWSNGKPFVLASWRRAWRTAPYLRRLSGTTLPPSLRETFTASWTASLRASRASRGVSPDGGPAPVTSAGSGTISAASFATWNPTGSFSKTCRDLFAEDSIPFAGPWPKQGSLRNGSVSPRPPLALPIDGNGSSSWPTPRAFEEAGAPLLPRQNKDRNRSSLTHDGLARGVQFWQTPATETNRSRGGERKDEMGLDQQARAFWATPMASDGTKPSAGNRADADLTHQAAAFPVSAWPTPNARDHKEQDMPGRHGEMSLPHMVESPSTRPDPQTAPDGSGSSTDTPTLRRRLNPRFVAWLMGLPPGWSDPEPAPDNSARLAMQSYQSRQRSHFVSLLAAWGLSNGSEQWQ